jgi:uncharacterized protein (DUF2237 family)
MYHKNLLGTDVKPCSTNPMTGFYRNGLCATGDEDKGTHVVCSIMTKAFLKFTKSQGNDLSTPQLPYFSGLKPGNKWCLCAHRWLEAYEAGVAPPVVFESTNEAALRIVPLAALKEHRYRPARSYTRRGRYTKRRNR